MLNLQERNNKIRENGKATRLKRSMQVCKTFKFKIPTNRLSKVQKQNLKMMFVEAKWIYNYLLSKSDEINIFDIVSNYKNLDKVIHLDKDRNPIESNITHILSSVRQELMQQIATQIKVLAKKKAKGEEVGKLKFKSDFNSIKFKQYKVTHVLKGNKIKIQGIKEYIPLLGLKQIKKFDNLDITTMNLIKEVDNYYVCLTCYFDKVENLHDFDKEDKTYDNDIVGIDLGITDNLTLSNGKKISCYVEESERIKNLQRKIDRSKKGSNNNYKLRKKLKLAYIKDRNRKNDLTNQICSKILKENRIIVIQNDNLNEMKKDKSGSETSKTIQHSILGRVKSRLKECDRVIWLDKWCPTTQFCPVCGTKTPHDTSKRTFVCNKCGHTDDRDIHAANNMILFFLEYVKSKNINTSQELAGVLTSIKWNDIKDIISLGYKKVSSSLA